MAESGNIREITESSRERKRTSRGDPIGDRRALEATEIRGKRFKREGSASSVDLNAERVMRMVNNGGQR